MADNQYKIELGVNLNTSDLKSDIAKLDDKYKIKLGVNLGVDDIRKRISAYNQNSNNAKLNLKIKLDTDDLKRQINNLDLSGKGKGVSIPLNTASLETSLRELKEVIAEIKTSFNSLDSGDMNPLLSSVNQIVTALGKAENESNSLVKSLSALSKKDFSVNFGVNLGGSNPIGRNAAYGNKVRNDALPQLKQQAAALENYFKEYYKIEDGFSAIWKLSSDDRRFEKRQSDLFGLTTELGNSSGSLKSQMAAYKEYIAIIKEAAQLKGIDISSVTSGFSKSADTLVKEAEDIQTGANEMQDSFEKLKGIFSGGIDADGLSQVLQPLLDDIKEIRKAFESLSSIGTIDGLTTSFKDLSEVLEKLTSNITVVKQNLDNIGNVGVSAGNVNNGIENLEQDLKQVENAAENASDAIRETVNESKKLNNISVDISDGGIDELKNSLRSIGADEDIIKRITNEITNMGIVAKNVSGTLKEGDLVKFDVQGIQKTEDGLERIVTLKKTLNDDGKWINSESYTQSINNDFEKLKNTAKEISNLRIDILNSDDASDINRMSAELDRLNKEFDELYANTKGGLDSKQISQIDNLVDQGDTKTLNAFNKELNEFVKLQNQIENTRFEIGKLEVVGGKDNEIVELKRQLEELEDTYNRLMNTFMKKAAANGDIVKLDDFKNLENGITTATVNAENRLERFKSQYADTRAELARKIKVDIELGNFDDDVSRMQDKFDKLSRASKDLYASVDNVYDALSRMNNASKPNSDGVVDTERLIKAQQDYARAIKETNNLIDQQTRKEAADARSQKLIDDRQVFQSKIDAWLTKNSAATKNFGEAMLRLKAKAENCDRVQLNHLIKQFTKLDNAADKAGLKMESFGDSIKRKLKEYSAYFSVAEVFMYITQGLKDMFEQVKLIDSAMTELKKVTNETDATYNQFLSNAASRAKEIGTTIDGLVSSTADFARLGYGFKESQGLAEVANIYAVVGDDIDSVETATQSLISTLTAFKDEANGLSDDDFALSIVDKMNEVSNNFAISSGGIGDALQRSASSMMAANNSLDETIALITAANTVVQDPDAVGTAFKTISMRIRGKIVPIYNESYSLCYAV